MNRRTTVLLALLGLTLLITVFSGSGDDAGDTATVQTRQAPNARSTRRGAQTEAVDRVVELRSASLDSVPSEYQPGRDPFRFYQPPRKAPPPTPPPKPVERKPPPVRPVETRPPEPQGPQPPPIEVSYLGSFGPTERPIAVFTDGEEIYNVRLGDVMDGKFRVVNIGYESVDLAFVNFPEVPAKRLPIGRANGG